MPTYTHRCPVCGEFDQVRPMSAAGSAAACPDCGAAAPRVFGAPSLRGLDPGVRRALDASARSADAPEVVASVPGTNRRATPVTRDPRHARLPRP
ncbi:FmdB family zinc ribbon protein [Pseudonocardia endophytica]|uniref:Putative FmdB family regulatory protein n=1 Tax=Pseudonocardia endophytica TaxID=401976 RepID=A0A4R1HTT3_PSEEN|nr:FmdB family zinc ribbon protein [Pseudonocardia endophytica]TCK24801.1 putative FmdB family regulatory protein [Pseudonocardia endophytica]